MRIIKADELQKRTASIITMAFAAFPEEQVVDGDGDGAGSHAPQQIQIDVEAVQREAAAIIQRGKEQAAVALHTSQQEAERTRAQMKQEQEQARAQAAADADAAKKEAYAAGFSSGEEAGFKKGYEDGFSKGKQTGLQETADAVNMIEQVIEQLKGYHSQILTDSQKDIAQMAIAVAEKVLHKEVMTDPNTVISVVRNALSKISFKKQFVVHVNPLDLEVLNSVSDQIRETLGNYESLKFKASPQVEPGGCVVQTESGMVDAQISRQFGEVKEAVMNAVEQSDV
jgi:flagellar assembly protein FliH